MMHLNDELWPAQLPPRDFAVSTVEQMLKAQPQRSKGGIRAGTWVGLACAALFISGAAYGWSVRHHGAIHAAPHCVGAAWATSIAPMQPRMPQVDCSRIQVPRALSVGRKLVSRRTAKTSAEQLPSVAAVPVPSTRPAVPKVPPCGCQRGFADFICDCY